MKIFKLVGIMSCLALFACSEEETPGGDLFGQQAILYKIDGNSQKQARFYDKTAITVSEEDIDTQKEEQFVVALAKENTEDISVRMALSPQEVQKYNETYGTSFLTFPDKDIELTRSLQISAGSVTSEKGSVKVRVTSEMEDNTPYMFAISMVSASSKTTLLNTSQTLFYTIEKVKGQIKKSVKITRDEYFTLENTQSIGSTFTMEGLIYVERFRQPGDGSSSGISTFMGVEGKTLMRFGDRGVDPDHLQANGTDIGVKFRTKQWYHIALVVDGSKTTAYVNGEKVIDFNKSGSLPLNEFYIGRSYNSNRGIDARFSEIRLWKTARSAQEIKDNMYEVKANETNLLAYWKMNEVKNEKILDASPNGINLILMGQAGKSGRQPITIFEEPEPIKVN